LRTRLAQSQTGTVALVYILSRHPRLKVAIMDSPEPSPQTQDRLIGDLRQVIENAEELLKNTDQYTSLLYQSARAKLALALHAATEELGRFEDAQLTRIIEARQAAHADQPDQSGEARLMRAFSQAST
jgi:ElaB/YqjD/DUF883 family membrane-anchored ribosome-binding protein